MSIFMAPGIFSSSSSSLNPQQTAQELDLVTDVKRDYGASGSNQSTTGSITANSTTLTLANPIDFQNGQGISIANAGPLPTIPAPTSATATAEGTTGSTTIGYAVAALDGKGGVTASFAFSVTNANATLSSTNYVALSVTAVTNAAGYAWYRTSTNGTSPTTTGFIGVTPGTSLNDTGLAVITPPIGVPASAPSSALGDLLVTSITAGAGTTSLTLATAATTTMSKATVNHDDTAAIQSMINQLQATGSQGGIGHLSPGNYLVSSTINITGSGVWIIGEGPAATQLIGINLFTDLICFNGANESGMDLLTITYPIQPISGAAIHATSCGVFTLTRFQIYQANIAIEIDGTGSPTFIANGVITSPLSAGIHCNLSTGSPSGGNVEVHHVNMSVPSGNSATGVYLQSGDTFRLTDVDILGFQYGVNMSPLSGQTLRWVFATNVACDSCAANAWVIGGGGSVYGVELVDCWGSTSNVGVSLQTGTDITLIGHRAINNQHQGISLGNGSNISLIGCRVIGNQQAGAGGAGIEVSAGVSHWAIMGGISTATGDNVSTANQAYGVYVDAGSSDYYLITGMDVTGNATAGIFDGGTGTHKLIDHNLGYNPVGVLTAPSIPASGTAQTNTFGVRVRVFVSGGTVSAIAINGTSTGLTSGSFELDPGETITLNYSSAPTWTWFGL